MRTVTDKHPIRTGGKLILNLLSSSTSAIAYSLRRLNYAFTSSPIRVRRSSDNAELDIPFCGNELCINTLKAFTEYSDLSKFPNPSLAVDLDANGINDGWTTSDAGSATRVRSIVNGYQRMEHTTSVTGTCYSRIRFGDLATTRASEGDVITVSLTAKKVSSVASGTMSLLVYARTSVGGGVNFLTEAITNATDTTITLNFTCGASTAYYEIILQVGGNTAGDVAVCDFKNLSVVNHKTSAYVTTWYDQSNNPSSNLLTYSEQFNDASWSKFSLNAISANVITAPNGTLTADLATETTATGVHFIDKVINVVNGTAYTQSWYVKKQNKRYVQLSGSSIPFSATAYTNFDLDTGTITASTNTNASIVSVGDGWYRISVTQICVASGTGRPGTLTFINSGTDLRAPSYTGDGTSGYYLWGAQINEGYNVLPYRQTTATPLINYNATQVTSANQPRIVNAGVLDVSGIKASIYYGDISQQWKLATPSLSVPQPSTFAIIRQQGDSRSRTFQSGDSSYNFDRTVPEKLDLIYAGAVLSRASGTPTGIVQNVGVFNGASSKLYENGTNIASGNAGTNNLNSFITIGGTGSDGMDGYISEFIIYPTLLSDAQRQKLEQNQMKNYGVT